MSVGRNHGRLNQAGDLAPFVSPWGQELAAHESMLIDQPPPIGGKSNPNDMHGRMGFGGTVGGMITLSANTGYVQAERGYFGDLPENQQALVDAADPWDRA